MAFALSLAGCDGDECVVVSTECAPLYEPTFDKVFERTLKPTCGAAGSSCHSAEGAKGGLVFADAGESHRMLLEGDRVIPGDPGCSEVVRRMESSDSDFQMPPGSPLSAEERCAVVQWIAEGAKR